MGRGSACDTESLSLVKRKGAKEQRKKKDTDAGVKIITQIHKRNLASLRGNLYVKTPNHESHCRL